MTKERDAMTTRDALPSTQEYFLRAMAANYAGGHCWDHLDGQTCVMAADEIRTLRAALAPTVGTGREEMREMGEQSDPVREALRRMIAEFDDHHYPTCPADRDTVPCDCFAGALLIDAKAALAQPPAPIGREETAALADRFETCTYLHSARDHAGRTHVGPSFAKDEIDIVVAALRASTVTPHNCGAPTDEQVKRAAQALFERGGERAFARGHAPHHPLGTLVKNMPPSYRDDYMKDARACLTAALADGVAGAWQPIETAPHVPYKRFLIGRLIGARFDWVATAERRELDAVWGRWDSGNLATSYIPTHWMEMPTVSGNERASEGGK